MKLIIKIFVFIIFMSGFQYVYAGTHLKTRPRWQDICPAGLEDSKYKEIRWFWPHSVRKTQSEINYWARKRTQFEEQINNCDVLLDSFREKCYVYLQEKYNNDFDLHRFENNQKSIIESSWKDFNYRGVRPIMIEINPSKKN